MVARLGGRETQAQSTAAPEATPAQNGTQANAPRGSSAQDAANGQQSKTESGAKPEDHTAVADPKKKEIVGQSADLLKLASSLKTEVDKTSADTLSIAVIRQADQIEKLAHKMRTK
jgi:hypothetical protein